MNRKSAYFLALSFAVAAEAGAQQYVYPANGQSPEQQKNDEAACYSWAVQQTGVDPANPPPQQAAPKPATTATGSTPGAGVVGAPWRRHRQRRRRRCRYRSSDRRSSSTFKESPAECQCRQSGTTATTGVHPATTGFFWQSARRLPRRTRLYS